MPTGRGVAVFLIMQSYKKKLTYGPAAFVSGVGFAAFLTGIYTGAGERNWVFYTFSTDVFGSFLNRALADLPLLPLKIYAENDPDWAEYDEMLSIIAPEVDQSLMEDE